MILHKNGNFTFKCVLNYSNLDRFCRVSIRFDKEITIRSGDQKWKKIISEEDSIEKSPKS